MKKARTGGWIAALIGTSVLTACAVASPTAPPATPSGNRGAETGRSVAMAFDPSDGSLLMADQDGVSRWRSGAGWIQVDIPGSSGVSAVAINPDEPVEVYASGLGLGVIRSDDAGDTWQEVNAGLGNLNITALALHSFQRETLFAWVDGEGVYRTEDGGGVWVRMPDPGPPDAKVRSLTHSTLPGSMNTGWLYAATPTGAYLSMDCF